MKDQQRDAGKKDSETAVRRDLAATERGIIDSIEDGYYECDLAGDMTVANDALCAIMGRSREEILGVHYRQWVDEANVPWVFEAFHRVYQSGTPARNIVYEIIRKNDGSRCQIEVSITLIKDGGGQPVGFRGIVRDVTERRKNEEALMIFRRFAEASGEGMGWSALDGRIVYANQAMCRILGEKDREATDGRYAADYYDKENRRRLAHEMMPAVMAGGEWRGELLLRRPNGEKIPLLNTVFLIRDEGGNPLYLAVIARDISDLKKTEQALRESEEKYRVLYDHAGDAIFVAQDGVIKFPNLQGLAMFGYTKEELAAIPFLELVHPDDREMVGERYLRRLQGEPVESPYTFRIFSTGQKLLWVQVTGVRIEWEGRPAVLIFLTDITELKKMEDQLRQKYKMEAVGTLAGGIAHDFNNILAGIMGYTDVIAGATAQETPAYKNLTQIRRLVMRARGLVKQLQAFSRSAEQDYSAVNMGAIVAEVLEMVRALSSPSVAVSGNITTNDCLVYANPVQIHAIVLNLCNNALQAMPTGGSLEVSLREAAPEAEFKADPSRRYFRLSVRDTGQGMAPEVRKRIFEPYFTTRSQGQGSGLGLYVVHGAVSNLGGFIKVDSRPGQGSTFDIYFPMMNKGD